MTDKEAIDRLTGINLSLEQKKALIDVIKNINSTTKDTEEDTNINIDIKFLFGQNKAIVQDNSKNSIMSFDYVPKDMNRIKSDKTIPGKLSWDYFGIDYDTKIKYITIKNNNSIIVRFDAVFVYKSNRNGYHTISYNLMINGVQFGFIEFNDSDTIGITSWIFYGLDNILTTPVLIFSGTKTINEETILTVTVGDITYEIDNTGRHAIVQNKDLYYTIKNCINVILVTSKITDSVKNMYIPCIVTYIYNATYERFSIYLESNGETLLEIYE